MRPLAEPAHLHNYTKHNPGIALQFSPREMMRAAVRPMQKTLRLHPPLGLLLAACSTTHFAGRKHTRERTRKRRRPPRTHLQVIYNAAHPGAGVQRGGGHECRGRQEGGWRA